jgi:hypothetical protein
MCSLDEFHPNEDIHTLLNLKRSFMLTPGASIGLHLAREQLNPPRTTFYFHGIECSIFSSSYPLWEELCNLVQKDFRTFTDR